MNLERSAKISREGTSTSSSRALAAAGAEAMRTRIDELVAGLRSALDDVSSMSPGSSDIDAIDGLDEKLCLALEAAEDVRDGLGKLAFISSETHGTPRTLDVHEPLELAMRMTRSLVGRRARLVRRYEAVPAVHADKTALMRVFAQLLQNAADAIPPYMPLANCISVRTYVDLDGSVAIEISDTGVGIAAENAGRVFEPFFTSKSGAASGLGLTIARGEVTAAGGVITVDSVEGRGSRFTVRLPASGGVASSMERVFTSELPHRRVLVVADEPARGEVLRAMFADDRTVVVVAHSDEAVDRLGMGEACDLVVVDADDDGCAELRERLADVAPDVVMRTFELSTRSSSAGTSRIADSRSSAQARDPSSGMWSVATR